MNDELVRMAGGAGPHVYTVDFDEPQSVVDAARQAIERRFSSFVPGAMNDRNIRERVCNLLSRSDAPTVEM